MVFAIVEKLFQKVAGTEDPVGYKQKPFFSQPDPEPIDEYEVEGQSMPSLPEGLEAKRFLSQIMPLCG
jgi:hypothetical protein